MVEPLKITIRETSDRLHIELEGDLDEAGFLIVSSALEGTTLDRPVKVNLKRVRHVDSTGLRALVLLQHEVRAAGQAFHLVEPSPSVRRVFQTTGLSQVFQVQTEADEGAAHPEEE